MSKYLLLKELANHEFERRCAEIKVEEIKNQPIIDFYDKHYLDHHKKHVEYIIKDYELQIKRHNNEIELIKYKLTMFPDKA